MRKKTESIPLLKNPRQIGLYIEKEDYDRLAKMAHSNGDKISKLVRGILNDAVSHHFGGQ